MKSKAAMFTLLLVLTRSVGISFGDINTVYVSGALGTGINAKKAVGIGMLPAVARGDREASGELVPCRGADAALRRRPGEHRERHR